MSSGVNPLVQDIGVCLVGAGVLCVAFERLRLPHVAAFLAAGVLVGPVGLSLVTDAGNIETIAHLGLTLLLFLIGLEVNLKDLLASGRALVMGGLLQVPLSILAAWGVFLALSAAGLAGVGGGYAPLYLAFTCAFSSTLIAVKLLQDRLRLDTVAGRTSVGLLIFQDIWAIVVLAVQPNFEDPDVLPVGLTFAGIAVVAVVAGVFARWVLPAAFRMVAKVPELMVTAALAWCFGLGLFGANLGAVLHLVGVEVPVSVSLEMGALLAGTSIATFPYAYDVVGKIANLRDFFVTLFFVALGMGIPVPEGASVLVLTAALAVVAVLLRGVVFFPLLYAGGLDRRPAIEASVYLAQVSEFCLVIAYLGEQLGHVDRDVVTAITLAFVVTAVGTPWMFGKADRVDALLGPLLDRIGIRARPAASADGGGEHRARLVLLGFHRLASSLLHDIERTHPELLRDTVVVDFNVAIHDAIRRTGASVVYGDLGNPETLKHAGVGAAEVVVSTVPDDLLKGTSNADLVRRLRAMAPGAIVVANAVRVADVQRIYEAGASYVFMWRTETARGLWPAVDAALNGDLEEMLAARRMEYGPLAERREVID